MCTYLCMAHCKSTKCLFCAILGGMMDNNKVWFAQVEIHGAYPVEVFSLSFYSCNKFFPFHRHFRGRQRGWGKGLFDNLSHLFNGMGIDFIGLCISVCRTRGKKK